VANPSSYLMNAGSYLAIEDDSIVKIPGVLIK